MKTIKIGNREVGENKPVFVVAEISANHLQDYDLAVKTIDAARDAGADAVKMQTYTPDTITLDCDNEYFQIKQDTIWDGRTLYQLYEEAYTPWEWQPNLKKHAEDLGMICFSSPFDETAVDFLEKINVPAYKLASFEITDIQLIGYMASKKKPMVMSTGIAEFSDIEEAIQACRNAGNDDIILLKCTSAYPTPLNEVNLLTMPDLASKFNTLVGLSDHTLGISVPIAAVSLGACLVEKHITTSRELGGPDSAFSLEPEEFAGMVTAIREVEEALGKVEYSLSEKTKKSREFARSLFVVQDIEKGGTLTSENVRSIRPAYGLHPRHLREVLGKKARSDLKKGTPLDWDLID
ncbi:MAG: pseudaminic acid synthase [Candidatus Hermodarchaeota archaeon]